MGRDVALEELVAAVGRAVLRVPALAVGAGGGLARLLGGTGLHPHARIGAGAAVEARVVAVVRDRARRLREAAWGQVLRRRRVAIDDRAARARRDAPLER